MASTAKLVLAVVRARGALLIAVVAFCLAAAVGFSVLAADKYRAVATLFIDPSPFEARALNGGPTAARGSELDLLRSERVAQRVVENERLVEEPALRNLYMESIDAGRPPLESLSQYVADRVEAAGSDDGGLVRLSVTMGDPTLAARVANAYAQAWGEVSLELRANAIRSGVERAHEDLVSLRARLGEARYRLVGGTALAAAGSRADEQFAQLSRMSTRPIPQSGSMALAESGSNGTQSPVRNAATALPLDSIATEHLGGTAADGLPPDSAGADRFGGTSRDEHIGAPIRPGAAGEASSADEEIRLAQQSLERAEDRLARIAAEGIGAPFPAHMLRPARVPEKSIKPGPAICAAIGLTTGQVLGILAMLLGERIDRRVRRPSDLSRITGIVVLGNLPAALPAGLRFRGRRALTLRRPGESA